MGNGSSTGNSSMMSNSSMSGNSSASAVTWVGATKNVTSVATTTYKNLCVPRTASSEVSADTHN